MIKKGTRWLTIGEWIAALGAIAVITFLIICARGREEKNPATESAPRRYEYERPVFFADSEDEKESFRLVLGIIESPTAVLERRPFVVLCLKAMDPYFGTIGRSSATMALDETILSIMLRIPVCRKLLTDHAIDTNDFWSHEEVEDRLRL